MTSVYCVRVKERDEGMCACVYFRLYVYDCEIVWVKLKERRTKQMSVERHGERRMGWVFCFTSSVGGHTHILTDSTTQSLLDS